MSVDTNSVDRLRSFWLAWSSLPQSFRRPIAIVKMQNVNQNLNWLNAGILTDWKRKSNAMRLGFAPRNANGAWGTLAGTSSSLLWWKILWCIQKAGSWRRKERTVQGGKNFSKNQTTSFLNLGRRSGSENVAVW